MANLNEITKKLNDAANALQSLASEQVKVVEHSVLSFINSSELIKKEDRKRDSFNSICDRNKEVLDTTESNLFKKRKSFYSSFSSLFSKSDKQITNTKSILKKFGQDTIKIFSKGLSNNSSNTNNITNDNTNDFLRTDKDSNEIQIELLTSINNKIASLSSPASGGLFDFLMNGIPKILSMGTAAEVAGGVGAAGVGAGMLAKYKKWFKLPAAEKLKPAASFVGKNLKRLATPKKLLGAAGISLAAGAIGLSNNESSDDNSEIEARAKGGKVAGNIPYLVGEKGPELFVPNNSGDIKNNSITNNITEEMFKTYSDKQVDLIDTGLSKSVEKFSKPFDKNIKKYSTSVNDQFKTFNDTFQSGWDFISDGFKKIVNKLNPFSSGDNSTSSSDGTISPPTVDDKTLSVVNSAPPQISLRSNDTSNGSSTTPSPSLANPNADVPRSFYGDYNVRSTGIRKLHAGEMVIPSDDSELLRAVSELKSNYSISSSPAISKSKLSEDFWMKTFVPAFASAIKIDRGSVSVPTRLVENSTNPFG